MPLKLLIVDDSKPNRDSLRALLASISDSASVAEAGTLAQAVQCARLDPPTLVILDLRLPDGLATEIIGTLKKMSPKLRVAVLTIHADEAHRTQCLALGTDWFFDKATEIDHLLDVVRQHIAVHCTEFHYQPAAIL